MTPFVLLSASVLAADLNGDRRIDGADIGWNLAAWGETAPAKQANILANWGKEFIVDVHGQAWEVTTRQGGMYTALDGRYLDHDEAMAAGAAWLLDQFDREPTADETAYRALWESMCK
jgi:hypothetical protein